MSVKSLWTTGARPAPDSLRVVMAVVAAVCAAAPAAVGSEPPGNARPADEKATSENREAGPTAGTRAFESRPGTVRAQPCLVRLPLPGRGNRLDCVNHGTRVEELRTDGAWSLIRIADGSVGWAAARYLEPGGAASRTLPTATIWARPCLPRRGLPSRRGMMLDCLAKGAVVTQVQQRDAWSLARSTDGAVGWVQNDFLVEHKGGGLDPNLAPPLAPLPLVERKQLESPGSRGRPGAGPDRGTPPPAVADSAMSGEDAAPRVTGATPERFLYPTARVRARICSRRLVSPEPKADALDCLPDGTRVELLGHLEGWTQVRTARGKVGWIANQQLDGGFGSPGLVTDGDVAHVDPAQAAQPDAESEYQPGQLGVVVDKWATGDESSEGLVIVGMLRNMGVNLSTGVALTVQVYDYNDRVVLEQQASIDTTILMPGQGTRFEATLPGVFAFRALNFDISTVDYDVIDNQLVQSF